MYSVGTWHSGLLFSAALAVEKEDTRKMPLVYVLFFYALSTDESNGAKY